MQRFELQYRSHFILSVQLSQPHAHRNAPNASNTAIAFHTGARCHVALSQPKQWSAPTGRGRFERYEHFGAGVVESVARHVERAIEGRRRPHLTADDVVMMVEIWESGLRCHAQVLAGEVRYCGSGWWCVSRP